MNKLLLAGICAGAILATGASGRAAVMLMDFTNIHPPIVGIASYNGTSFVSSNPVDDFTAADGVSPSAVFHNAVFNLTGFNVLSTSISDPNLNGVADTGENVTSTIGSGNFTISSPAGLILSGSFTGATMSSSIGSSGATINTSNVKGLVLTPGSAFIYNGLPVLGFSNPESFTIGLSGVPGAGVQVTGVTQPYGPSVPLLAGTLSQFGSTSGSINMSAAFVVPEPATIGLLSIGVMGLAARRRRA